MVSAPTLASRTTTNITINAVIAASGQSVQYARNSSSAIPSSGWQTTLSFGSLSANTEYYIFARSVSNSNYETGEASAPLIIRTLATATFTLSFEQIADDSTALPWSGGSSLTVLLSGSSATLTLSNSGQYDSVKWFIDGAYKDNDSSYVLDSADFIRTDAGTHSLTVEVVLKTNGYTYNRTIPFEVK